MPMFTTRRELALVLDHADAVKVYKDVQADIIDLVTDELIAAWDE